MADKTDTTKLLESLEKFCLEYRAWRYIALNYCLGEEPQKLTLVQIKFWRSLTWTALDRCYGPSTPP